MIDYRYPGVDYWEAGSRKSAAWLAKLIQELMNMRMVKVRSHYVRFFENRNLIGYDAKLDLGESVSIKFLDDEAGSTLKISLFLEDKDRDIFLVIWQNLINSGYVFDEVFKRDLTAKNKEKDIKSETSQNNSGQDKPNNETKAIKDKFAYLWIRREFVRMKNYNLAQFLQENDAPSWLSPKALTRHMKIMCENGEIEKMGRLYVIKKK